MLLISQPSHLHNMALCHIACFPKSLSSRLGVAYVKKTLEWFLANPNRFLFHIEIDGKIVGYCGGFVPQKVGDGSSSGMLQHAFNEAISGLITHPWLLLHSEVRQQYRFLWLNIKRKFTGKTIPMGNNSVPQKQPHHVGLVVIGVHPDYRGSGVAKELADEFEKRAKTYSRNELMLSVKKDNTRAINAYKKFGWGVYEEGKSLYVMTKIL